MTGELPTWHTARARLWARAAAGWADAGAELAWLDCTTGDRWGAADQRSGEAFTARLQGLFAAVRRLEAGPGARRTGARLLVTSHRPLDSAALAGLTSARRGVAVAMGHPSLAADLSAFLGEGWQVGQVYDCDVADVCEPETANRNP
jgi:hypothetical protein